MVEDWLLELLKGSGRLFIHPLFYLGLIGALAIGMLRVKRERRDFNTRVHDVVTDVKGFFAGILFGLVVSVLALGLGIVMPEGVLVFIAGLSILLVITLQVRWISSAFIWSIAILAGLLLPEFDSGSTLLNGWLEDLYHAPFTSMSIMMGLLLAAEGMLVTRNASRFTSPRLKQSKRGKVIGSHQAKKLWLVPVFMLVPGDSIKSAVDWWPVVDVAGNAFSIWAIPFTIGFYQRVQGSLPKESIRITGKRITALSLLVLAIAVGSFWIPILNVVAVIVALIGREVLAIRQRSNDNQNTTYFSRRDHGLVILGVLPESPAEKMGLHVGEIVTKVNGKTVHTEKEFYEALQANLAFCRLEVLDFNGEVRFAQRALYDGEHYELGLLFVHDGSDWDMQAV